MEPRIPPWVELTILTYVTIRRSWSRWTLKGAMSMNYDDELSSSQRPELPAHLTMSM